MVCNENNLIVSANQPSPVHFALHPTRSRCCYSHFGSGNPGPNEVVRPAQVYLAAGDSSGCSTGDMSLPFLGPPAAPGHASQQVQLPGDSREPRA